MPTEDLKLDLELDKEKRRYKWGKTSPYMSIDAFLYLLLPLFDKYIFQYHIFPTYIFSLLHSASFYKTGQTSHTKKLSNDKTGVK